MKKYGLIFVFGIFMFLIPFSNVFAYSDGLMNNGPFTLSELNTQTYNITDNDLTSFYPYDGTKARTLNFYFDEPITIDSYRLLSSDTLRVNFRNGNTIATFYPSDFDGNIINLNEPIIINEIEFVSGSSIIRNIYEFDVYNSSDISPPDNITNLEQTYTNEEYGITYDLPTDQDFSHLNIYKNDVLLQDNYTLTSFSDVSIVPTDVIKITSVDKNGNESDGVSITIQEYVPSDTTPPGNIGNIDYTSTDTTLNVTYDLPTDEDFDYIKVLVNGETYQTSDTTFSLAELTPETEYEITFISVDNSGNESDGLTVNVTTLPAEPTTPPEVRNLQINTEHDRVDLTWENPKYYYEKTIIYRKESSTASTTWNPFAAVTVHADSTFTPIFETNGTEFSDLTIEPEKNYEYKVTTMYNGMESDGVVIAATVPKPPLIDMDNVNLPFGVQELLQTGNGLLYLIGSFVLLGLAFVFVPMLIKLIRQSVKDKNKEQKGEKLSKRDERYQERAMKQVNRSYKLAREPRQSNYVPRGSKREGRT